jgi:farnesyl-diphosphate farnesyltransferase
LSREKAMNEDATKGDWAYCCEMLPKVSRTFAVNIGELQGDIFRAVLIGYLLFRMADTFEDNVHQDERGKIADLTDFSELFQGNRDLDQRLKLYESLRFRWEEHSYEKNLIENGSAVLRCYFDLPQLYRGIIDPLLVETSRGMAEFQRRKLESKSTIFQLRDIGELENYCYYVAGVVGIMLTKVFCQKARIRERKRQLEALQVDFGLALQLINVVKDYEKDIARGWCYIPSTITKCYSIDPNTMDTLSAYQRRGIVDEMVAHVVRYLDSALRYIQLLPLNERSIRKFCILPFVMGYRTLVTVVQMAGSKISREEVATIVEKSAYYAESNHTLEEDYLEVKASYLSGARGASELD